MKLVEMKCTNCGAKLKVNPDSSEATCKYCRANFKFDDGVKKVKFDDIMSQMIQFGGDIVRKLIVAGLAFNSLLAF